MARSFRRWLIPAAVLAAALRCGGGDSLTLPPEGLPSVITQMGGDAQTGVVGQRLTDTLVVRLTDSRDRPVQGQAVEFRLIAGGTGAVLIPDTALTNADGQAKSVWVLGQIAGQQRVEARVLASGAAGGLKSNFTATARADQADTVFAVKGQGQSGAVGAPLADSLAVVVTDRFGNPVAGEAVSWAVPAGEGSVSAAAGTTGADGRTAVLRTLGPNAGPQSATATAASLPAIPVVFDHSATAGGAVKIVKLSADPPPAPAGTQLADSLVVQVQDANGNGVPNRSVNWVASGNGQASPSSSVTDAGGKAFTFWTLSTTAGNNTLTVAVAGLPQVQFAGTGTAATPTHIASQSLVNLNGTAGQPVTPVPAVKVTDQNGNPVQGVPVTFAVTGGGGQVSDGSGSAAQVTVPTGATGVAALVSWVLGPVAGTNIVEASAMNGAVPLTGSPVSFTAQAAAGTAAKLVFLQQPTNTVAGNTITPAVTVAVQDANGNTVTGSTASVTVAIGTNAGGGTLGGTRTVSAAAGIATFGLNIDKAGRGYTLTAAATGLSGASSAGFDILPGPAARLGFVQQPTTTAASQPIAPAVTVAIQDGFGNTVTTSTATVDLALGANPTGATLGGTLSRAAVAGVATFADLSVDKTGSGYTLAASSGSLAGATSSGFNIGSGQPARLAFQAGPTTTQAGVPISPAVTVVILDSSGNPVPTATDSVVIALGNNAGGATLAGTLRRAAVNGVAVFGDLTLDRTGSGYTLSAADPAGSLTGATSGSFDITLGTGRRLAFQAQPTSLTAGAVMAPAVLLRVEDLLGNLDPSFTGGVTLALANNPGTATLGGTLVRNAVAGVATFDDLTLDRTGTGYTLAASVATGVAPATSTGFDVTAGAAAALVFSTQPGNTVAGSPITPAPRVAVQDALGNVVTAPAIQLTIAIGTNPSGGTLSGTLARTTSNGAATFSGLSINLAGTGYTLQVSGGGLPVATSSAFNIQTGTGNKLAFLVQPANGSVGSAISPPIQVEIQDGAGNRVTTATDQVSLVFGNNPGGASFVGGTPQVAAVAGVATFAAVTIDRAGAGYTLSALASGLVSATSGAFDVGPAATAIGITGDTPDPTVVGQPYNVSFSVTSPGGAPSGTVTVSDGTDSCSAPVSGGSCILTSRTTGAKGLVAGFTDPAGNFQSSVSAAVSHTVNQGGTILLFSDTPASTVVGEPITAGWTVTVNSPAVGIPTGLVTVTATNGSETCSAPVAALSCQLVLLARASGTRTLTASYAGDANFAASQDSDPHTINRAATATTVGPVTPGTAEFGQPVSVGFTVTPVAPGGGTPAGTVTVTDNLGGSCTAAATAGSCSLTPAASGAQTLTASYPQDGNYSASTSTALNLTINPAATTTAIVSPTPASAAVGQAVSVSVLVSAQFAVPAGGVTVTDGAGASCTIPALTAGAGSCSLTPLVAGSQTLTASYTPASPDFSPSSGNAALQVGSAATTTAITAHTPDPVPLGSSIAVSVSVTATGATPTGSVVVSDNNANSCTVAALSGGTGSCNLTPTLPGTKTLTAVYTPNNANFTGSTSAGVNHTVSQGPTTTTVTAHTPDPSVTGQPVTASVTVTATAGTPTGSVTVGDGVTSCVVTLAAGAGSCQLAFPTAGGRTLTATYGGDANFAGSSGAATHTVNPAPTATAIVAPTPTSATVGQPVTVSVQVTAQFAVPAGGVAVSDGAGGACSITTLTAGTGSCSLTPVAAGSRTLTASYTPSSADFGSSAGNASLLVAPAATATTITAHTPDPVPLGGAIAVSVSVTATGATPTGSVVVSDNNANSCTITTLAAGAGSCNLTPTLPGTKTLTAVYTPNNANFTGSTSAGVSHTVTVGSTTTTITAHTPDPSVTGQPVTAGVTVTATGGTPTGSVTVGDGVTSCVATLTAGAGSCQLAFPTAGGRTLTATYGGDANFAGSSGTATHTVSPAATTTAITGDTPDPSTAGSAYTVSFNLAVTAPGAGTPGGTVTVTDGSASCQAAPSAGNCSLTSTTAGLKSLVATYAGTTNFTGSTSAGAAHTVDSAATTTTITAHTPDPSSIGSAVAVGFTVASGFATPGGSVTVSDGVNSCTGNLTGGSGSCNLTLTVVGSRTLTASYNGDPAHATSTSAGVGHTVQLLTSSTSITSDTPDPSVVNQPVTVNVAVAGIVVTPTGTVTVTDGHGASCQAILSGGTGACNITLATTGAGTLTATYGGDALYGGSVGNTAHTVNPFGPADPGTTTATVPGGAVGQPTTIKVQLRDAFNNNITAGAAGTVAGSVTAGPNTGTGLAVTDNGDGSFTLTYTPLAGAGTDAITITLNGTGISGSPYASVIP